MAKRNIVLAVSASIAAYKACDIVSALVKMDYQVQVVMTDNACEFIKPICFESLSKRPVLISQFDNSLAHIEIANWADIFLIAPATANIIGKIANGIADDFLTTTVLATKSPVIFAPAMNTQMWNNSILVSNVQKLQLYGYDFIMPESGILACGEQGLGKLASADTIVNFVENKLLQFTVSKNSFFK
ncbi:MAG: bifunctional 4'-phosphopantothenoylcysteine decarboxylase/phosphopantothenoylcysteine synthetase, partial [Clostridiales bacterium]|nr:bifunctional 4'-phosphopantothenoylcysteine decarboxylase/phosphopantothenoylcysteine synthetase [Clostridiales bacterium]